MRRGAFRAVFALVVVAAAVLVILAGAAALALAAYLLMEPTIGAIGTLIILGALGLLAGATCTWLACRLVNDD